MKLNHANQSNRAMNLLELLVVVACISLLIALLLPALLKPSHPTRQRISCINNLKQVGLAYRLWAGDNNDKYPMEVSVTNGGAMELIATGNVVATLLCMSNELSTPKILFCPEDKEHTATRSFDTNFTAKSISYFIGQDANQSQPQMILSGDDNLALGGVPVNSGLLTLSTNAPIAWTAERHVNAGNIGFADGSAQQVTTTGLQHAFQRTRFATNRLAIP
jgi:prepilin-type processing-associated H-X9-DG protein